MIADEFAHLIKQHATMAQIDQKPFVYGHIASYDPLTHRVRCIIPSMQDENGTPLLSPWMPMGTPFAGAGYGAQFVYAGGATADNPTSGEQVLVGLFDRARGVAAVPCVFWSGSAHPPATNLPPGATDVAPGDVLLCNQSRTLLRLHSNGDFEIYGTANLTATVQGDVTVTTQGNATVTAHGTASIFAPAIKLAGAVADAVQTLCTKALRDWAVVHQHGTGPAPSTPMPVNAVTTIVRAD